MDNFQPNPSRKSESRLQIWVATIAVILAFVGSWLVIGSIIAGLALNKPMVPVWHVGWIVCGIGGSLFVKAYLLGDNTSEGSTIRPGLLARIWHCLKLGFYMILATLATPILASLACSFACLLTVTLGPLILALRIKKLLGSGSDDGGKSL
jgi:hypothetical protein